MNFFVPSCIVSRNVFQSVLTFVSALEVRISEHLSATNALNSSHLAELYSGTSLGFFMTRTGFMSNSTIGASWSDIPGIMVVEITEFGRFVAIRSKVLFVPWCGSMRVGWVV